MRRVVSVWLPTWPTDRLRRRRAALSAEGAICAPSVDTPLVTSLNDGRRRVIAAADAAALALGLRPGLPLAQAQAMLPNLEILEAELDADEAALAELAAWCLRYAPLTSPDTPDGVWIDITGCAHLHGGEAALLASLLGRLHAAGIAARAAVADTPGAAHAVARFGSHGDEGAIVVPPGGAAAALVPLPVAALRLPDGIPQALRRLGLDRIGQLMAAARAPLSRRFGAAMLTRLDQALGRVAEPIVPVLPPTVPQARLTFLEPLLTAPGLGAGIARLVGQVCVALEQAGQGARRLDLLFERVDGSLHALRAGTSRPARNPGHLARLLTERLEEVNPEPGVEAMRLVVSLTEPLAYSQNGALIGDAGEDPGLAVLVDRLVNRLGAGRVWRTVPVESDVPERTVRRVPPLASGKALLPSGWPAALPRPVRLFHPPQPVEAMSLLPDNPPVAFTWRRHRHRISRADGPERIFGEWWHRPAETAAVRDYFRVEDEAGQRFWLFRRGDGADPASGDLKWFLHGLF